MATIKPTPKRKPKPKSKKSKTQSPQVNIKEAQGKFVFEINHKVGGVTQSLTFSLEDAAIISDKLESSFEKLESVRGVKRPKKKKYTIVSDGQPFFLPVPK